MIKAQLMGLYHFIFAFKPFLQIFQLMRCLEGFVYDRRFRVLLDEVACRILFRNKLAEFPSKRTGSPDPEENHCEQNARHIRRACRERRKDDQQPLVN